MTTLLTTSMQLDWQNISTLLNQNIAQSSSTYVVHVIFSLFYILTSNIKLLIPYSKYDHPFPQHRPIAKHTAIGNQTIASFKPGIYIKSLTFSLTLSCSNILLSRPLHWPTSQCIGLLSILNHWSTHLTPECSN